MRIVELLKTDAIVLGAEVSTKEEMLDFMIDLHAKAGNITDRCAFKEAILEREAEGPTAIAEGICIPHAKNRAVCEAGITALTVSAGVDCGAMDGQPSTLFFMIAAPESGADLHLEALARLSTLLMDDKFRENLLHAASAEDFLKAVDEKETEKYGKETEKSKGFLAGLFKKKN